MQAVTTIGLDIAKSIFQVHGVDAEGKVVVRRKLKRRYVVAFFQKLPPCLVGIEACASSHHLVARTPGAGPYRAPDAASLCQALRKAALVRHTPGNGLNPGDRQRGLVQARWRAAKLSIS